MAAERMVIETTFFVALHLSKTMNNSFISSVGTVLYIVSHLVAKL